MMAWCPMCKSEYVEGVTSCVDCGCDLVDSLAEEKEQEEVDQELAAAMIREVQEMKESGEEIPEDLRDLSLEEEDLPPKYQPVYVNNEEKAEENRSSAYTLLFVGGIGLLAVFLFFFDVISVQMALVSKYMISGVMGVLFILFIVMGMVSLKNSKILKIKACKENNLTMEIKKWVTDHLVQSEIDLKLNADSQPFEIRYFQRIEYIKESIKKQFMNLDEAYLDRLIDEVYPEIFEENENQE